MAVDDVGEAPFQRPDCFLLDFAFSQFEVNQPDLPPEKVQVPKPVYNSHSKRDTIDLYEHPGTGLLIHPAIPRRLPRSGIWALVTGAVGISLVISSVSSV